MRFSERVGIRPIKNIVQVESMDDDLRNRLWNVLQSVCWRIPRSYDLLSVNQDLMQLIHSIWHSHLKLPTDEIPSSSHQAVSRIRKRYFAFEWYEVYDLIEFITNAVPQNTRGNLITGCTQVLQQELSGYRFVDGKLTPVTTKEEVGAIERAISDTASPFPGATTHLRTALAGCCKTDDFRDEDGVQGKVAGEQGAV